MERRTFLKGLAALPALGFLKPAEAVAESPVSLAGGCNQAVLDSFYERGEQLSTDAAYRRSLGDALAKQFDDAMVKQYAAGMRPIGGTRR